MNDSSQAQVMSCAKCQGPVMQDAEVCKVCNTPVSGKEFPYVVQRPAEVDVTGLLKWWGVWCLIVWAVTGFSYSLTTSLLWTGVSAIYLVRLLRGYYR
jgi:hypothetical protein